MSKCTILRFAAVASLTPMLLLCGCGGPGNEVKGSNRVILLLDGSGSFRNRQAEAVDKAVAYLEEMSRTELKRWESSSDKIAVITVDSMPDVLWEGNLEDLKKQNRESWVMRFRSRQDYSACTDVVGAFRLAANYLDGDARTTAKYLVVFSDLVQELPRDTPSSCQHPQRGPAADFPWDALGETGVTVLWLPVSQRLLWQRVASQNGVAVRFYTESESSTAQLQPPPKKVVEPTAQEQKMAEAEVTGFFTGAMKLLVMVPLVLISLMVALIGGAWLRHRFANGQVDAAAGPRSATRPLMSNAGKHGQGKRG